MRALKSLPHSPFFYLGLVLIIFAIFGLQFGLYSRIDTLLFHPSNLQPGTNLLSINTLLNYGKGNSNWHNRTDIPIGWNFYQLTTSIARVDSQLYSSPGLRDEHLVVGINGVESSGAYYWTLWIYCQEKAAWWASPVGADLVKLSNNQTLSWFYQNPPSSDPSSWKPPVTGAAKVDTCQTL